MWQVTVDRQVFGTYQTEQQAEQIARDLQTRPDVEVRITRV